MRETLNENTAERNHFDHWYGQKYCQSEFTGQEDKALFIPQVTALRFVN